MGKSNIGKFVKAKKIQKSDFEKRYKILLYFYVENPLNAEK